MAIAVVEVQVLSSASKAVPPGGFLVLVDGVRRSLYSDGEHTFVPVKRRTTGGARVLTARQQEIWNYLVEYVDRHGYPPTVREIGEQVGLASPSTVHAHLANLERAGLLNRDPTKPRALELIGRERREPRSRSKPSPPTSRGCRSSARSPPVGRCSRSRTSRTTCPMPRLDEGRLPAARQGRVDDRRRHPRR